MIQIFLLFLCACVKENITSASFLFTPPLHKAKNLLSTVIEEGSRHFVCSNATHKQQKGSILLHSDWVI